MAFIGHCIDTIALSHGLMISLFLAGLVGGFTHCAGMCSPFVLAQIDSQTKIQKLSSSLLLPYHLGRMTTYITLAVLVSSVINLAFLFSDLKTVITAPLLMLAGVLFLISAFPQMAMLFPWANRLQVSAPYQFITRFSSGLIHNPNTIKRYGLGVLLGFMPCGLVVSALLASSTAENSMQAALAMGSFTLGTIPALILVAIGGNTLKTRYPKATKYATQTAMIISSLWLFILAGRMLF